LGFTSSYVPISWGEREMGQIDSITLNILGIKQTLIRTLLVVVVVVVTSPIKPIGPEWQLLSLIL
jgi:hypothetical protein